MIAIQARGRVWYPPLGFLHFKSRISAIADAPCVQRLCRPAVRKGSAFPTPSQSNFPFLGEASPRGVRHNLNPGTAPEAAAGKAEKQ